MITIEAKGDYKKTYKFLFFLKQWKIERVLDTYGKKGVDALQEATPKDTGKTAASWSYTIETSNSGSSIIWTNSNINNGVNIALILQYGHGTGTGGYVEGIDYINPALKPVFDKIAEDVWKEVTSA